MDKELHTMLDEQDLRERIFTEMSELRHATVTCKYSRARSITYRIQELLTMLAELKGEER